MARLQPIHPCYYGSVASIGAAGFTLARNPRRGPPRLLRRLSEHARVLRHAYRILAGDVRRGEPIAPAAEWLLGKALE